MIFLIIVAVVLLVVGYYAPLPPPLPLIFQIIGWIVLVWGLIELAFFLTGSGYHSLR